MTCASAITTTRQAIVVPPTRTHCDTGTVVEGMRRQQPAAPACVLFLACGCALSSTCTATGRTVCHTQGCQPHSRTLQIQAACTVVAATCLMPQCMPPRHHTFQGRMHTNILHTYTVLLVTVRRRAGSQRLSAAAVQHQHSARLTQWRTTWTKMNWLNGTSAASLSQ